MKILLDMNVSTNWIQYLQALEFVEDVRHWSTLGAPDALDTDILAFSHDNDFIIFTRDLDFGKLLVITNSNKPSIIQLRVPDARVEACGEHVLKTLHTLQYDLVNGAIVTIHEHLAKVRVLPMKQS